MTASYSSREREGWASDLNIFCDYPVWVYKLSDVQDMSSFCFLWDKAEFWTIVFLCLWFWDFHSYLIKNLRVCMHNIKKCCMAAKFSKYIPKKNLPEGNHRNIAGCKTVKSKSINNQWEGKKKSEFFRLFKN